MKGDNDDIDLASLRSQLLHYSSELQSTKLSIDELKEMKWSVKKKIYIELLSLSPSLCDFRDQMASLLESRAIQLRKNAKAAEKQKVNTVIY